MINVDDRLLSELDESEMYLVLHIAKHMKANRMTAWPSLDTLSKACKWDERTVKKHRQSLIKKGFLEMTMQPGKPTLYRFLKDGIGVYRPIKTDEMIAENEGTYFEGGTKNEGTQNVVKGVQKMRGVRVQKMYPEVIKDINSEMIKKEEKDAALFSSSSENSNNHLEAEKETPPPSCAAPPPISPPFIPTGEIIEPKPATIVRLYTPELPNVTLIEPAPSPEYQRDPRYTPPQELCWVNIPEEIEQMRSDPTALEGFVVGRKLPRVKFTEYLNEFEAEQIGLKTKYKDERELRLHFLNWSGVHHQIAQKQNNGKGSSLTRAGGDLSKYEQKQIF